MSVMEFQVEFSQNFDVFLSLKMFLSLANSDAAFHLGLNCLLKSQGPSTL